MTTVKARHPGPTEAASACGDRPVPYPLTVDLYDRLVDSGVFGDRSPIYLWKGQLVLPTTKGPYHGFVVTALHDHLSLTVPRGAWHVRQETPTRVSDHSEPEPDLTVVRGAARDYLRRHPGPADVGLAVEVADSSLRFDTGEKLEAYAAAGIPTYWVVNIPAARIEAYSEPSGGGGDARYRVRRDFGPDDEIALVLDGVEVGRLAVRDVLP